MLCERELLLLLLTPMFVYLLVGQILAPTTEHRSKLEERSERGEGEGDASRVRA